MKSVVAAVLAAALPCASVQPALAEIARARNVPRPTAVRLAPEVLTAPPRLTLPALPAPSLAAPRAAVQTPEAAGSLGALKARLERSPDVAAPLLDRFFNGAALRAGVLGAVLLVSPNLMSARTQPASPPTPAVLASAARHTILPNGARIEVEVEDQVHALADPVVLKVRLVNPTGQLAIVNLSELQAALQEAAGSRVEIVLDQKGELVAAPGTATSYNLEADVENLPATLEPGKQVEVQVPAGSLENVPVPGYSIKVGSVQQSKGPSQIRDVRPWPKRYLDWLYLALWGAAIGAGLYVAKALKRAKDRVAAEWRRRHPPPTLVEKTLMRLAGLEADLSRGLDEKEFFRRLVIFLCGYLEERYELGGRWDAGDLEQASSTLRDMARSLENKGIPDASAQALKKLGRHSEQALYAERDFDPARLKSDLALARGIVEALGNKPQASAAPAPAPRAAPMLFALPFAHGLAFQQPLWLLLLLPLAAYMIWRWTRPAPPADYRVPTSRWIAPMKSWRQRLRWLPEALLAAGMAVTIAAMADPTWGYKRGDQLVTSLDTVIVVDRSGSMSYRLDGGMGSKISAAKDAAKLYLARQDGTTNRVGLFVFESSPYMVSNLTLDYDALNAAFSQIEADGGTDIGEALEAALSHFLEMNIVDADPARYAHIEKVRETLKTRGLAEALAEAQKEPGLLEALLGKDRNRVIILLTDGADGGNEVSQAVAHAKALNVRVFGISVPDGNVSTLESIAQGTGGKAFDVQDKAGLNQAFTEIDQLEKAMVRVKTPPSPIHHDWEFAQKVWLLLALGLLLGATPFQLSSLRDGRRLTAIAVPIALLGLLGAPRGLEAQGLPHDPPAQTLQEPRTPATQYLPYREIPEVLRARQLYDAGRYQESEEELDKAAKKNPTMPEIPLYKGMAQAKAGDSAGAQRSFDEAVRRSLSQHRTDVLASTEVEQGNLAAKNGDTKEALGHYRDALRIPEDAADDRAREAQGLAKSNYEALLRGESPGQGQQGQDGAGSASSQSGKQDGKPGQKGGKSGDKDAKNQDGQGGSSDGKDKKGQDKNAQDKNQTAQGGGSGQKPSSEDAQKPKNPSDSAQGGTLPDKKVKEAVKDLEEHSKRGGLRDRGHHGKYWGLALGPGLPELGSKAWHAFLQYFHLVQPHGAILWHHPMYLTATAIVVPVLGYLAWRTAQKGFRAAQALAGTEHSGKLLSWAPARSWLRRTALLLAALSFFGLAAAAPTLSSREERFSFGGEDVEVLQDVSGSVRWSADGRYKESTAALEHFIQWLETGSGADRVTVAPFAGTPGEAVLSNDYHNALFRLYHMVEDAKYLYEGTDLAAGITQAVKTFEAAKDIGARKRTLIIISDGGEDNDPVKLREAAALAAKKDITIYTIGIGSKAGARMIDPDSPPGAPKYMTDDAGNAVVTGLNDGDLKTVASVGGGGYFPAEGGKGVDEALAKIAGLEQAKQQGLGPVENSISRVFLLPGLGLMALALYPGRGPKKKKMAASSALALAPIGLLPKGLAVFMIPGLGPVLAVGAGAALLVLAAAALSLPAGATKKEEKAAEADRQAEIKRAADHIRIENILRGQFLSPKIVRSGTEPDDAVPYTDEAWRDVDHRVTAHTGILHAKRFEDEPEIPFMIVADMSRSADFGSRARSKRDVIADVAGALAQAAARDNMPVGAVIVTDKVEKVFAPKQGLANARAISRALAEFPGGGAGTDLAAPVYEALPRMKRRGVVAVLSDFDDAKSGWEDVLAGAGKKHVVLPILVEDAVEQKPLEDFGLVEVQALEGGERGFLDTRSKKVREAVLEQMRQRRTKVREALERARAHPLILTNEDGYLDRLVGYFNSGGRDENEAQ